MDYQRLTTRVPDGFKQLGGGDLSRVPQRTRILGEARWNNDQWTDVIDAH